MSEINQSLPALHGSLHEDELLSLKKQMRSQEADWKKNKAVLEQRIEILELQNRELKEREENLKKMNNSIFSALKDINKENDPTCSHLVKELEASKQQISREFADHRIRNQEALKTMEKENKELKEKILELESKYSQTALHYEKNDSALQQRVQNLENEKKSMSMMIKMYEDERKQQKEKELNQNELQSKLSEVRYLMEKQVNEHRREIEKLHHDYTSTINNIKAMAESEKTTMENQIRKFLDNKKLDVNLFEDIKKRYESEIANLKRERESSLRKIEALELQISQMNETMKAWEEKINQQKAEQEREAKESKKMKLRLIDVEAQLKKYEQTEKSLRQMLTEKEYKIEEISADFKKKIGNEKRRYDQAQEVSKKHKDEIERRCALIMQESMKKDEVIKKLKGQLRSKEEKINSRKGDNEANKTDTSIVNMSLVSQSISKFNPSRSFIQEIKTTRDLSGSRPLAQNKKSQPKLNRDNTQRNFGKENNDTCEDDEDVKDLTSENILLGLNSPRTANSANTCRNYPSSKNEKDGPATATNRGHERRVFNFKRDEKTMLNINLCESCNQELDMNERNTEDENNSYSQREKNLLNCSTRAGGQNFTISSLEVRKKSASLSDSNFHCQKISFGYPGGDAGKITPIDYENSRSFLNVNELGGDFNLTHRGNAGNKNNLSLNPSMCNLSKGFQEIMENNHKNNMSGFQHDINLSREGTAATKRAPNDDKTKTLEEKLQEAEQKNEKLALEKEKMQVELDRLVLELKQTKMEWALSEEGKEECELALKNEIKFLINKLLQVKGPSASSSSFQGDMSRLTKSTLNKSTMDPQLSFINTSGFSNISHYNPPNHFASFTSNNFDQNNMTIINNNLVERKRNSSTEKKTNKKGLNVHSEESDTPLKARCLNTGEFDSLNDSPRRVSEFNNNENSLLMNLLNTSTNPKKLMRHVKR